MSYGKFPEKITIPAGMKTRSQLITEAVDKENAQTTKEWDAFLAKWPGYVEGANQAADAEAVAIAEIQGKRSARMDAKLRSL